MVQQSKSDAAQLLGTLGDAWLLEPGNDLLERLSQFDLPGVDTDLGELAIAWSETFLHLVPPYASLFLSEDGMLNAGPAEEVAGQYSQAGFTIDSRWRSGAPDHLGVELHFLAYLILQLPDRFGRFLEANVMTWAPVCCLAVERADVHPLYTAVARLTLETLVSVSTIEV